jgi:hypothetical protein
MTEDQLEREALGWLADQGWQHRYGPDLAPDGSNPERTDYRQVLLLDRLRQAVAALNPGLPQAARDDAVRQVIDLGTPVLLAANRHFHRLLVTGVPVQYQRDGETRGDFVRLVDWADPARNEWLAVNQFSITGPRHTRRPDIMLFVNGLPLVLIELKNPADPNADVWKAFDQIQTYKEQIADAFHYNEVLVISDGSDALLGSLSADTERFMAWRTIDGVTLDPLGPFNELQTLVRGVLAPQYLLDYLRFFVLFEDDGGLICPLSASRRAGLTLSSTNGRRSVAASVASQRPHRVDCARFGTCGLPPTPTHFVNAAVQSRPQTVAAGLATVRSSDARLRRSTEAFLLSRWPSGRGAAADPKAIAAKLALRERVSRWGGRMTVALTQRAGAGIVPTPNRRTHAPWASGIGCSGRPRTPPQPAAAKA